MTYQTDELHQDLEGTVGLQGVAVAVSEVVKWR